LIAYIGAEGDQIPEPAAKPAAEKKEEPKAEAKAEEKTAEKPAAAPAPQAVQAAPAPVKESRPAAPTPKQGERVKASPIARRLAEERGVDIAVVPGTGPGGRITRDDVLAFVPKPSFAGLSGAPRQVTVDGSDTPLTSMRQAIARVTVRSKTQAPHYYVTHAVNMSAAMQLRQQLNSALSDAGDRVSVNDMIVKATVNALVKLPKWNSFFADDKLTGHSDVNIGIAIALDQGLIVPALMRSQGMSLIEVSRAVRDLGNRARGKGGSLSQEELTLGTFSISNLGMFGTDTFAAIIVPPQAAILATGAVKKAPIITDDGEIEVADMMNATLSADHRVGDGAEAAVFLNEIKKNLENPVYLMM
jgi:pyruvate dehydrogenase E2 component (dihydrolipoamide acetyltransferase)